MHSLSDPVQDNTTLMNMGTTPRTARPSRRERDNNRLNHIQERALGTDSSVHVHGWDELRWILQLGPHLLAAAAHQNPSVNADSPQEVEAVKQRRQEYVRSCVIHKKVKKATTSFLALHPIEPKSDIYVVDEDVVPPPVAPPSTDHPMDDVENQAPHLVDQRHVGDHSHEHDLTSVPCCAICLKGYHVDEEIYWSHNPKCCHHFHSSCVEMWLLRNDNCPLCRELYVSPPHEENSRSMVPAPPLRADQIEILERGTTDAMGHSTVPTAMEAEEFMEMMVGIERLYQRANNRMILQTQSGHHFQITISRPDSPTLSDIESELFPDMR